MNIIKVHSYLFKKGTLDHPISKMTLDSVDKGNHVIIEIDPKFFSIWDFGKT